MIHCCWRRAIRRMSMQAGVLVFLVTGPAFWASADDTFVVRGVEVDVTAETASQARDQALAEGERRAFRIQLERLTSRSDWDTLPQPTNEEIAAYVESFEVASEKSSAVRYIATLNYAFREPAVRRLLAERDTPFAMTRSKPVAIVPVYQDPQAPEGGETPVLWGDPNPWREVWTARSKPQGLVPLVMPTGDAGVITAEQALQGDPTSLSAITRRSGAFTALVAYATREDDGLGTPRVKVSLNQYGPGGPEHNSVTSFTGREGETIDDLLARAADGVALEMDQVWKGRNLVRVTGRSVTAVTMPLNSLSQWQTVKERLKRVPVVQHTELVVLSRDHARLNLFHMGTPDQLAVALRQADLDMSRQDTVYVGGGAGAGTGEDVEEKWILRLPSAGAVQGR